MIEQNSRARKYVIALAIIDRDEMAVGLRDAVGAAWVEGRLLVLRHFAHLPEHLARRRLVEPDGFVDHTDGFEHSRDAQRRNICSEDRLLPRRRHKRLRRQVVHFSGPYFIDRVDH